MIKFSQACQNNRCLKRPLAITVMDPPTQNREAGATIKNFRAIDWEAAAIVRKFRVIDGEAEATVTNRLRLVAKFVGLVRDGLS